MAPRPIAALRTDLRRAVPGSRTIAGQLHYPSQQAPAVAAWLAARGVHITSSRLETITVEAGGETLVIHAPATHAACARSVAIDMNAIDTRTRKLLGRGRPGDIASVVDPFPPNPDAHPVMSNKRHHANDSAHDVVVRWTMHRLAHTPFGAPIACSDVEETYATLLLDTSGIDGATEINTLGIYSIAATAINHAQLRELAHRVINPDTPVPEPDTSRRITTKPGRAHKKQGPSSRQR